MAREMALELEPVLEQREIGDEALRADCLHFSC
jgi:hypothetical protein